MLATGDTVYCMYVRMCVFCTTNTVICTYVVTVYVLCVPKAHIMCVNLDELLEVSVDSPRLCRTCRQCGQLWGYSTALRRIPWTE